MMPLMAKFCRSLRNRPLWHTLGPFLVSSAGFQLQEAELHTHDLELPLGASDNPKQKLHVLLLTPQSLEPSGQADTAARITRFSTLAHECNLLIALLQQADGSGITTASRVHKEDCHPLLVLQKLALENTSNLPAILSIPDPAALLATLEMYIKDISNPPRPVDALSLSPYLLSHATATAPEQPLSQHTTHVLSDLFPSMQALSRGVRTSEGLQLLREYFDASTVDGILKFWGVDEEAQLRHM